MYLYISDRLWIRKFSPTTPLLSAYAVSHSVFTDHWEFTKVGNCFEDGADVNKKTVKRSLKLKLFDSYLLILYFVMQWRLHPKGKQLRHNIYNIVAGVISLIALHRELGGKTILYMMQVIEVLFNKFILELNNASYHYSFVRLLKIKGKGQQRYRSLHFMKYSYRLHTAYRNLMS